MVISVNRIYEFKKDGEVFQCKTVNKYSIRIYICFFFFWRSREGRVVMLLLWQELGKRVVGKGSFEVRGRSFELGVIVILLLFEVGFFKGDGKWRG